MGFFITCRERSANLKSKWDWGLHYRTGCDIMGYIHRLNRTEMGLVILILQKKIHENSIYHASTYLLITSLRLNNVTRRYPYFSKKTYKIKIKKCHTILDYDTNTDISLEG